MIGTPFFIILASWAVLSEPMIYAQDLSGYQQFQFGMNLPAVAERSEAHCGEDDSPSSGGDSRTGMAAGAHSRLLAKKGPG